MPHARLCVFVHPTDCLRFASVNTAAAHIHACAVFGRADEWLGVCRQIGYSCVLQPGRSATQHERLHFLTLSLLAPGMSRCALCEPAQDLSVSRKLTFFYLSKHYLYK